MRIRASHGLVGGALLTILLVAALPAGAAHPTRIARPTCTARCLWAALATRVAEPTSTATPSPTATPTATSTPAPIVYQPPPTPAPRFERGTCSGGVCSTLYDRLTGIGAAGYTAFDNGQTDFLSYTDSFGLSPTTGSIYLFVYADEKNVAGRVPYVSSYFNFRVEGPDGRQYLPYFGAYPGSREGPMPVATLRLPGDDNFGWMRFEIPIPQDHLRYTVLWNESDTIPWTPIAELPVG